MIQVLFYSAFGVLSLLVIVILALMVSDNKKREDWPREDIAIEEELCRRVMKSGKTTIATRYDNGNIIFQEFDDADQKP